MIEEAKNRICLFATKGVFVDSNLLLLLIVGAVDPLLIEKHRRTSAYSQEDYILLTTLLQPVTHLLTTPHVATEVNNLLGTLPDSFRFTSLLRDILLRARESYERSSILVSDIVWQRLGIADTALTRVSKHRLVLTDDLNLALTLERAGSNVINFNHLRQ
jgi:hypothetical protein